MPDALFAEPRLARIYDALDGDRNDLDAYLALVDELGVSSVLDIGCGTGTFACLLAARGIEVVAADPAAASLDVARSKPHAVDRRRDELEASLRDAGFAVSEVRDAPDRPGRELVFLARLPLTVASGAGPRWR